MLVGGEGEALKRLQRFALEVPGQVANQAKAFSGSKSEGGGDSLYGANFSCKISPWLAMGCLSPRRMFEDLKKDGPRCGFTCALPSSDFLNQPHLTLKTFFLL
jgi:deoxyribodipyrimidine photo-lyase